MNEYLGQTILNAINCINSGKRPEENEYQKVVDEDDQVWYVEACLNGVYSRWTVDKP